MHHKYNHEDVTTKRCRL